MKNNGLRIADLIDAAKNEIREAIKKFEADKKEGNTPLIPLIVQEITIEAQVTTTDTADVGGELGFYVVKASTKGTASNQSGQKVTIKLYPANEVGEFLVLGDSEKK